MRQIWFLSEDEAPAARLQKVFAHEHFETEYVVQHITDLQQVPQSHMEDLGVVFVIDAFHTKYPGFTGLEELRENFFQGPVFLLGEPAPEDALEPMRQFGLCAFMPPHDRTDFHYLAGVIHTQLHFEGRISLSSFLDPSGKSALESIQDFSSFNKLVVKLINFVSRFGVDINSLKKTIVSLSSANIKHTEKGPEILAPFELCYGIDAEKLIVGVSMTSIEDLPGTKKEFLEALRYVKSNEGRGDFLKIAKNSQSLIFVGGHAGGGECAPFLMTCVPFDKKGKFQNVDRFSFAWLEAVESSELSEGAGPEELTKDLFEPEVVGDTPLKEEEIHEEVSAETGNEEPEESVERPQEEVAENTDNVAALESQAASSGAESAPEPSHTLNQNSASTEADDAFPDSDDVRTLKAQLSQLKFKLKKSEKMAAALSADVERLMKERREPATDADLQAAMDEMSAKAERLQGQNKKLNATIDKHEEQIDLLQAQVDRLKTSAA